jgi:hypothetical protein
MRNHHNPSLANRTRKHPLAAQADKDWQAGLAIMLVAILCAFLCSLPSMTRARFDAPNELEREPVEKVQTPDWRKYAIETKGK